MDARYILAGILAALLCLVVLVEILSWLSRRRRDQAAQAYLAKHQSPGGKSYAVGSAEHNAQVVAMIHQVNEQLAKEGKRVPERIAMDIINQEQASFSQQEESE